jgi:hypothetical protein
METFPDDILNEIIVNLDRPSLLSTSLVSIIWKRLSLAQVIEIKNIKEFENACRQGDILSITKTKFNKKWLNYGLHGACEGGPLELVDILIEKGATDWNNGLRGACKGGDPEIVRLMMERGADDWGDGVYKACQEGHLELVKLMIEKCANCWNYGLQGACEGGHLELVKLMIEKGANDWNRGLYTACRGGDFDIVKLMIEKGATGCMCCRKSLPEH